MMTGRVLTRSVSFETRQHKIFSIDLGEGVPRRAFLVGLVLVGVWFALLTAIFGLPTQQTLTVYLTIPTAVVYIGFRPSKANERHYLITRWALKLRYIVSGHRGIVNGRLARRASDKLRLRERIDFSGARVYLTPWKNAAEPWSRAHTDKRPFTAGEGLEIAQVLTVYPTGEFGGSH